MGVLPIEDEAIDIHRRTNWPARFAFLLFMGKLTRLAGWMGAHADHFARRGDKPPRCHTLAPLFLPGEGGEGISLV